MNKKILSILFFTAFCLCGCNKFLEVKPKGIIIPETEGDYEAMLNSPTLTQTFPINLLEFTDDFFSTYTATDQSADANGYYWRPIITVDETVNPDVWGPLYHCIYDANVIIQGVTGSGGDSAAQKESVRGEALVIRASCYLDLLTVFAKSYNKDSAVADPGLPLVTSINVTDKAPQRSSLQATLDTMINDVRTAINVLPTSNINRYRVTTYAAYGLLSRIYLYMAEYDSAEKYVEAALLAPHSYLNYNNYATSDDFPVYDQNPEVLWQRAAVSGSPIFDLYSDDLKSYFTSDDLRYTDLTVTNNNGLGRASLPGVYNFGITFPEMDLTRAELLARKGQYQDAMAIVNNLRKNRILASAYADETAISGEDALEQVLTERRRELAYSGLRWFDMKRLDREGRMPAIQRINPETLSVDATLAPHSMQYTFEIPIRVSAFNPDMQLNYSK